MISQEPKLFPRPEIKGSRETRNTNRFRLRLRLRLYRGDRRGSGERERLSERRRTGVLQIEKT